MSLCTPTGLPSVKIIAGPWNQGPRILMFPLSNFDSLAPALLPCCQSPVLNHDLSGVESSSVLVAFPITVTPKWSLFILRSGEGRERQTEWGCRGTNLQIYWPWEEFSWFPGHGFQALFPREATHLFHLRKKRLVAGQVLTGLVVRRCFFQNAPCPCSLLCRCSSWKRDCDFVLYFGSARGAKQMTF